MGEKQRVQCSYRRLGETGWLISHNFGCRRIRVWTPRWPHQGFRTARQDISSRPGTQSHCKRKTSQKSTGEEQGGRDRACGRAMGSRRAGTRATGHADTQTHRRGVSRSVGRAVGSTDRSTGASAGPRGGRRRIAELKPQLGNILHITAIHMSEEPSVHSARVPLRED